MQELAMPYGDGVQRASVPDGIEIQTVDPLKKTIAETEEELLSRAMEEPIGAPRLQELARPDDTAVIVINDHTRPGPTPLMLDAIITRLRAAGVSDGDITLLFATGSHRAPTEDEARTIIGGKYYGKFRTVAHDCKRSPMTCVGRTESGVDVCINSIAAECSLLITTGLIAPHHCAGYSGGRKSILPGIASLSTIHAVHSFPVYQYEAAMGFIEGNPFHELSLAAAKTAGVRYIVNAVQDPHKQSIAFVAGDLEKAHAEGVRLCAAESVTAIPKRADIVIASPGGFPRDIDLYQSQKALAVAELIGSAKCAFIIVAECRQGFGEETFKQWMQEEPTPQSIIDRYAAEGFNVGNNKAFNYARALKKGKIYVVTDKIPRGELVKAKLDCSETLRGALDAALSEIDAKVITVIPHAANIVPKIAE